MSIEEKREIIRRSLLSGLEHGLYGFGPDGPYAIDRLRPDQLYHSRHLYFLLDMMAEEVLKTSTAGVVGYNHPDGQWLQGLARTLKRKGIFELPVTEISRQTNSTSWGFPLEEYPPQASVTLFTVFNTTGEEFQRLKDVVENRFGLIAAKAVSLIHRHPKPFDQVVGIPLAYALHLPLPLYKDQTEAQRQSSFAEFGTYDRRRLTYLRLLG